VTSLRLRLFAIIEQAARTIEDATYWPRRLCTTAASLAMEYGLCDIDGKSPRPLTLAQV